MHSYLIAFNSSDKEIVDDIKKYIHTFEYYAMIIPNVYLIMTNISITAINSFKIRDAIYRMIGEKSKNYQLMVMKTSSGGSLNEWATIGLPKVANYIKQF